MLLPVPFVRLAGIPAIVHFLYGVLLFIWGGLTLVVKLWCAVDLCFYLLMAGLFALHQLWRSPGGQDTPVLAKKVARSVIPASNSV